MKGKLCPCVTIQLSSVAKFRTKGQMYFRESVVMRTHERNMFVCVKQKNKCTFLNSCFFLID